MVKVLLARTADAPGENVSKVRNYLRGLNCQILETYSGFGTEENLQDADLVIVIGNDNPNDGLLTVDKPVHELLDSFKQLHWDYDYEEWNEGKNVLIVSNLDEHVYVDEMTELEDPDGSEWSQQYGGVYTNECLINLSSYIGPKYGKQSDSLSDYSPGSISLHCAKVLKLI